MRLVILVGFVLAVGIAMLGCGGNPSTPALVAKTVNEPTFPERARKYLASAREMIEQSKHEELMTNVKEYCSKILKLHSEVKQPKPTTVAEEEVHNALENIATGFPLIEDAVTRKIQALRAKDESKIKSTSSEVESDAKLMLESCDKAEELLNSL